MQHAPSANSQETESWEEWLIDQMIAWTDWMWADGNLMKFNREM